jgi:hypothetical protein
MEKVFLGISGKGNPLLGISATWELWSVIDITVVLFGFELLGIQFKRAVE